MAKAIIIGSGIAGLATAIRLSCKGYDVEVFEANTYVGGKLSSFNLGSYKFNFGPQLLTMPHYIDELFELCGELPGDKFIYKKKEISCKYFWDDGIKLTAYSNKKKFFNEIEEVLKISTNDLKKYLQKSKRKYELTKKIFLENSLHKLKNFFSKETIIGLLNLNYLEINKTLADINEEQIQEPHLVQLYNRFATYNGSNPYQTPGIMSMIQHLENHYGTFVAKNGMGNISESLKELCIKHSVKIHLNSKVEKIEVKDKKVQGVVVKNKFHPSDLVISNMDIYPTYRHLLKKHKQPTKILEQERSSSAVIFYWGIKKKFPELDLHNIFFSNDYKQEFENIFEKFTVGEDLTVYVNITSKDNPTDAPDGCENWYVMVNTPFNNGQDWKVISNRIRKNVIKKLNKLLKVKLEDLIEEEMTIKPSEIEQKTKSYLGALYGTSSNSKISAFLRHPNFSKNISNLYFCGGSVHPGGGIPLCLMSAKIVSELIPKA
ncbi:MAG: 1-hydroxycarotenoid 3,4-desaturase CrtD [Bacteroidota bacterium]|nr:1-hydroxycarotenoid 3,4-desaturase CrtD [Bacteroidota bacterium]